MANKMIDRIFGWVLAIAGFLSVAGSFGYNSFGVGLVETGALGAVVAGGIGILIYMAAPRYATGKKKGFYVIAAFVILVLSVLEVLGYLAIMPMLIDPWIYGLAMAILGIFVGFGPDATKAQSTMAGSP